MTDQNFDLNPDLENESANQLSKTEEKKAPKKKAKTLKSALIKKDFAFQIGMGGRSDIYVTINLKKDQIVTDLPTLQALSETDANVEYFYE